MGAKDGGGGGRPLTRREIVASVRALGDRLELARDAFRKAKAEGSIEKQQAAIGLAVLWFYETMIERTDWNDRGLGDPIWALHCAIHDLTQGIANPLLKPVKRAPPNADGAEERFRRELAAITAEAFMRAGRSEDEAARIVASALPSRPKVSTVKGWRKSASRERGDNGLRRWRGRLPAKNTEAFAQRLLTQLRDL
jgi:hypothetical protein